MSRIGRHPIDIPEGVNVNIDGNSITVSGKLGTLNKKFDSHITFEVKDNKVYVTRASDNYKALHGLYRQIVHNMITGVSQGFSKKILVHGIGYKGTQQGEDIVLNIGYSHPVVLKAVDGIKLAVEKSTAPNSDFQIIVSGIDKELVGQFASNIKDIKPVEPYHLYGIRYEDEVVMQKEIKSGKK